MNPGPWKHSSTHPFKMEGFRGGSYFILVCSVFYLLLNVFSTITIETLIFSCGMTLDVVNPISETISMFKACTSFDLLDIESIWEFWLVLDYF